jgi:hypothetical protein
MHVLHIYFPIFLSCIPLRYASYRGSVRSCYLRNSYEKQDDINFMRSGVLDLEFTRQLKTKAHTLLGYFKSDSDVKKCDISCFWKVS